MPKKRAGHTDKRQSPAHDLLVECETCYAKVWVRPEHPYGMCRPCQKELTGEYTHTVRNHSYNDDEYWMRTPRQRPTSCKPPQPAHMIWEEAIAIPLI